MISIKTEAEIESSRLGGKILAEIFREIKDEIQPGSDTAKIDKLVEEMIARKGAFPAFKGYRGYKYATCTSLNEEIVHGLPGRHILRDGDIVGLDIGVRYNGYCADMAQTFMVGEVSKKARKLVSAAKEALRAAIKQCRAGNHLGDIGFAIESVAHRCGFTVVKDLFGHGIGKQLHEDPLIPNYGRMGEGILLKPGMVFAIEPMLNLGGSEIETLKDGWTIVTVDRKLSAHFEHTIVVRENEAEILTNG